MEYMPGHTLVQGENTRHRRGLINFIGDAESFLFGTARNQKVNESVRKNKNNVLPSK